MIFEEQFPSLLAYNRDRFGCNFITNESLTDTIVEKYCLDKQKVREAIMFHVGNSIGDVERRMLQLLKELGL